MSLEKFRNFSEEEKEKKRREESEWYKNLFEDEKQSLIYYRKRYIKWGKIHTDEKNPIWCLLT